MVVRGAASGRVIGSADLLLVVTRLMFVVFVVVEINLAAESHTWVISHLAVLKLVQGRDRGL